MSPAGAQSPAREELAADTLFPPEPALVCNRAWDTGGRRLVVERRTVPSGRVLTTGVSLFMQPAGGARAIGVIVDVSSDISRPVSLSHLTSCENVNSAVEAALSGRRSFAAWVICAKFLSSSEYLVEYKRRLGVLLSMSHLPAASFVIPAFAVDGNIILQESVAAGVREEVNRAMMLLCPEDWTLAMGAAEASIISTELSPPSSSTVERRL